MPSTNPLKIKGYAVERILDKEEDSVSADVLKRKNRDILHRGQEKGPLVFTTKFKRPSTEN